MGVKMKNITDYLEIAAYIFIFCIAGTLLLYQNRELNYFITAMKNVADNQNILYEQSYDKPDNSKVSYAELITVLSGDIGCDIQINDLPILKENYNYQEFDFSGVPQSDYTKSYQYDYSGNIVKVIYTGS